MATNSEVLTEATKSLNDFKTTMMAEIMKKREFDADTIKSVGMLTLYLDTAVSNISGAQSLYDQMTAGEPVEASAEMTDAATGMQADARDTGAED